MTSRRGMTVFAVGVVLGVVLGLALGAPRVAAQRGITMQMVATPTFTAYCFTNGSGLSCLR